MGSGYSNTNLERDCASFEVRPDGNLVRWGDSFELFMGKNHRKENIDNQEETWSVQFTYKTDSRRGLCCLQLKAISSGDSNGNGRVKNIHFSLGGSSVGCNARFTLKIGGGITSTFSPSTKAPMSFTRYEKCCLIETTIFLYGCSDRNGIVLEMKQTPGSESADMATLAHYFVSQDVGLCIAAKICGSKMGNGFGVEVEGPFKHPVADLHHVIHTTKSTGVWSPTACSHYNEAKGSKTGISRNASVMTHSNNQKEEDAVVSQVVKHDIFSKHSKDLLNSSAGVLSNHQAEDAVGDHRVVKHDATFSSSVREQYNKGLINSSGYTTGYLNNTIIFMKCKFLNL